MQLQQGQANGRPLVSIVMAARNEETHIKAAIESILSQTYTNWELLVVDDYSGDATCSEVRRFGDERIRLLVKNGEPPGAATTYNLGVLASKGEYITYQDADDTSYPERIERQIAEALKRPGRMAVGCRVERWLGTGVSIMGVPLTHNKIVKGFRRSFRRNTFVCATLLWPRVVAKRFLLRPMFKHMFDWDLLCRLSEADILEFRNVPDVLYRYILRPKGSKMAPDWVEHNVFVRACQNRRARGLAEWTHIEEFKEYVRGTTLDRFRWGLLTRALELKAGVEMRTLREKTVAQLDAGCLNGFPEKAKSREVA